MSKPDQLAEITARVAAETATPADVQWRIAELAGMNSLLDELRYRINCAGTLMNTSYVANAIGHTRVPWRDPRTNAPESEAC